MDSEVRFLHTSFCCSRSAGGASVLKTDNLKGYAGSSPVCSVGIYLITRKRVCSDCSVRHKILAESQGVQGINTWTSCLAGMYITPAIQDFQPIHPAVYLRAADPARPVLRDWWVTDPYLQLQEPSGALFIFKGQRWLIPASFSSQIRYRTLSFPRTQDPGGFLACLFVN